MISKLDQIIDNNSIVLNDLIKNDNDNPYRKDFVYESYESLCRGNHSAVNWNIYSSFKLALSKFVSNLKSQVLKDPLN